MIIGLPDVRALSILSGVRKWYDFVRFRIIYILGNIINNIILCYATTKLIVSIVIYMWITKIYSQFFIIFKSTKLEPLN